MATKETKVSEVLEDEEIVESDDNWVWKLAKPVTYNGEEISELRFNFEKLTGRDALEIENELMRFGKLSAYTQVGNINYLMKAAARACEKPIGEDFFNLVSISDFNTLRNKIQLFLLSIPS